MSRVLIADDDRISCKLLGSLLTKWGYETDIVHNGDDALRELLKPDAAQLAILDWMMPGLDGIEVIRKLRTTHRESYTYVLLLTAKGHKEDLIEGLDAGADDYLKKPFDAQELRARLRVGADRKNLEGALREAERKYRGIFDNAIFGIFQSTPSGRYLSVNPAMARIFGYDSAEEMINTVAAISQLYVDPKRRDEFVLGMDRFGAVQNFECEAFRKNGNKICVATSARAIRENGVVVRYEGMTEDITERKLLQSQLLHTQKLESIGQLAAGIAHEINTPTQYVGDNLRFLKGAFQELKDLLADYERMLAAAQSNTLSREAVQEIVTAVQCADAGYLLEEIPTAIEQTIEGVTRVSALVSAMKEFSHPGTKEKTPVDLNHAIENTLTVAGNEWKYVAHVETEFDPSLPLVSCLPGELNQVILNLIVNAAHAIADVVGKAGSEKGKIRVQTRNCPEWVEIRIQDTGTGIPEKVRARIFDPFFTTKEIGKGTGQGLSIARSVVVDKHGGSIHFETEEGKGTTFIVRLPRDGKALAAKAVSV
jgi:two-component system, NtrC family, sensor kinase